MGVQDLDANTSGGPPLEGLRVVDFSRVIAGPYLTSTLADLGCEVIKIENPAFGDDTRASVDPGKNGQSAQFVGLNRSKQSVVLDLQREEAKQLVLRLVREADIVVENFRPGTMDKLGIGYERLREANPRLIYCSLSGYGHRSKYHKLPGYDPAIQAETGYMYMTGDATMPPIRSGGSVIDVMTGMNGAIAILAALNARATSGKGQFVNAALFDTAIAALGYMHHGPILTGKDPKRLGNRSFFVAPNGLYTCSDGQIMLTIGNDKLFRQFALALGHDDWPAEELFATNATRLANVDVLDAAINETMSKHSRDHWISRFREFGVPGGSVKTSLEVLESEEVRESGMMFEVDHPVIGSMRTIGSPLQFESNSTCAPRPAPVLDEHTDDVLKSWIGLDGDEIAGLRQAGAIGKRRV